MYSPTYNFTKMGFEYRYFIYNMADVIVLLFLISLCIPIIAVFSSFFPKSKYFHNAGEFLRSKVLIAIINIMYLKFVFMACLNLSLAAPDTAASAFNSFLALSMIVILGLIPIFYLVHVGVYFKELKSLKKSLKLHSESKSEENKEALRNKADSIKQSFRYKYLFSEYNNASIF